ncbi:MAG: hypothetical protein AVDCRST_MAG77-4004, partial [uncultured Chloroflexi bacterium]
WGWWQRWAVARCWRHAVQEKHPQAGVQSGQARRSGRPA